MLFVRQHLGPAKKKERVCLLVLLSLLHSCYPCPRPLCACRRHGNPGKPRKPSRNSRNKQKTQKNPGNQAETSEGKQQIQENPGNQAETAETSSKTSKTQETKQKNISIRLRVLSTNKAFFCLPYYPLSPPPPRRTKS